MTTSRRDFLQYSMGAAGVLGLSRPGWPLNDLRDIPRAPAPMRILILGGTSYIGPHQVRYALARGHTVTLFS